MATIQVKLSEFSDLITRYTSEFVGRKWLVNQINMLLDESECRIVVVTGGPGVGKTALLAHLAATHPQWLRYFIRRDSKDLLRPGDANTFLLSIGGQLATLYPQLFHPENMDITVSQEIGTVEETGKVIGAHINELLASPFYRVAILVEQEIRRLAGNATGIEIGRLVSEPRLMNMQDLQYLGLLDPARRLVQNDPDARIVVLVDALDELRYSPAEPDILRALAELPEIPPNVRFVVSSRAETFLGRLLSRSDTRRLQFNVTGIDNKADLAVYAESIVATDSMRAAMMKERIDPEIFVRDLLGKSAGNFLYLRSVLNGIQDSLADETKRGLLRLLLNVREFPSDLGALYGHFISAIVSSKRDRSGKDPWREYLRPLLGALAVAQEPLSEELLSVFSGLKKDDIQDLLRDLRQFVDIVNDKLPLYRIYHVSFAEYLLDSKHNREYCINGEEKHNNLVNRYLDMWGGLNTRLPGLRDPVKRNIDGGYGLRHLAAHLEGANREQDLHRLLWLERVYTTTSGEVDTALFGGNSKVERQHNHFDLIWYTTQEQVGNTAGFLGDLSRAWRLAEHIDARNDPAKIGESIGLQIRYALISATINSLVANIPIPVLVALVEKKIWSVHQGLIYAQRVIDFERHIEALCGLLQYLPDNERVSLAANALDTIQMIGSSTQRANALKHLAPHLPERLIQKAFILAMEMSDVGDRTKAISSLALYLPVPLLAEALKMIQTMKYQSDRAWSLSSLAPYLPETMLREALALAEGIENDNIREEALVGLVPHLARLGRHEEALAVVQMMGNKSQQMLALSRLLPYLSGPLQQKILQDALSIAKAVNDTRQHASTIDQMIPYTPKTLFEEALVQMLAFAHQANNTVHKEAILVSVCPHLPDSLLDTALAITESIDPKLTSRLQIFEQLLPRIAQFGRSEEALTLAARSGVGNDNWGELLTKLAPYMSNSQILQVLRGVLDKKKKNRYTPKNVWSAGWDDGLLSIFVDNFYMVKKRRRQSIKAKRRQMENVFADIHDHEMETGANALYKQALVGLVSYLPEQLMREALVQLQAVNDQYYRAEAQIDFVIYLPESHLRDAANKIFETVENSEYPSKLLAKFATKIGKVGYAKKALKIINSLDDEEKSQALRQVAPYLSKTLCQKALKIARSIDNDFARGRALAGLIPQLARFGYARQGLTVANEIGPVESIIDAITGIAPNLPVPLRQEVLNAAFREARALKDIIVRPQILAQLAPYMSELEVHEFLTLIRMEKNELLRTTALNKFVPKLSESSLSGALEVARSIKGNASRDDALEEIVLQLAMLGRGKEGWEVAQEIIQSDKRHYALGWLTLYSPAALSIDGLSKILSEPNRWKSVFGSERKHRLASRLADTLSFTELYALWSQTLHISASQTRQDAISNIQSMAPLIAQLGGKEAMAAAFHAIQDIGDWWS